MATFNSRSPASRGSPSPAPGHKIRQVWTPEEDRMLSEAVAQETPAQGPISWHKVASHLSNRNNKDCRKRWHYSIANTIRKGTWMREEDERLRQAVEIYGARWSKIAEAVGTRNGDQCWKRWYDCLDPRIDKSPWTAEEDARLLYLVSQHGRNWSDIVHQHFPNRTSLAAKNRYSILRRKQEGNLSRTSSARNPKSRLNTTSSQSNSTPSLSPSPYLSVPTTPNMTGSATPELKFEPTPDWMVLSEAEIDELLQQQPSQMTYGDGLEEWCSNPIAGSATSSSQLSFDFQLASGHSLKPQTSLGTGVGVPLQAPQMHLDQGQGGGSGGYYSQGQQQHPDFYDPLGICQNDGQNLVAYQEMYGMESGLMGQGGMPVGSWQGGLIRGGE